MQQVMLSNGVGMPVLGYGVFQITDAAECERCVGEALARGYRLLDTAAAYRNEQAVGAAVACSGIARSEVFVTTKLWVQDAGYDSTLRAFDASLKRLGLDYIDLYLIHQPFGDYYGAWRAMERLYREGAVRAIGVSNFSPERLVDLCMNHEIRPMVNQIEFHPGYPQTYTVEFCKAHGILPEAWSPLGRTRVLQDERLAGIAAKYGKSVAQLCVRFALQCGVAPLPKSSSPARMQANLDVFDFVISDEDMDRILTLPQFGWSGLHPDYPRETIG